MNCWREKVSTCTPLPNFLGLKKKISCEKCVRTLKNYEISYMHYKMYFAILSPLQRCEKCKICIKIKKLVQALDQQ